MSDRDGTSNSPEYNFDIARTSSGDPILVSAQYILDNRAELEKNHIPFYRVLKKNDGNIFFEPMVLHSFLKIPPSQLEASQYGLHRSWEPYFVHNVSEELGDPAKNDIFAQKLTLLLSMTPEERLEELNVSLEAIEKVNKPQVPSLEKAEAIVDVSERVFLINRATMSLDKKELSRVDQEIVKETQAVVSAIIDILSNSQVAQFLFQVFSALSNGQTLDHVIRVFSTMVSFIQFYNRIHNQGIIQKIRLVFKTEYSEYYRRLLPKIADHLFTFDNLLHLPFINIDKLKIYALGALFHDIGKISNIDYFESDASYDQAIIRQHVLISSGLILRTYGREYEEARLIAGDHHNALFHKDGYGVTRWERERGQKRTLEPKFLITESAEEYLSGNALGFLPVEICAIVDIFDALTDKARHYKRKLSPAETMILMQKTELETGKIDPILFDLFVDFMKDSEIELPENLGFNYKYKKQKSF